MINTRIGYLKRYVPYRFLSTFITGLTGLKDSVKNQLIIEKSRNNPDVPYLITDDEKLIIDTAWLEYFYLNRVILEGWARMKLTGFLQSRNSNVPANHMKLEAPVQRNLTSARDYWKSYLEANPESDIFTSKLLKPEKLSIDHFIPWSFVLHDKIWNLVPTTREINSSKNNRLPPWERFFPLFSDIQYRSYKWHTDHNSNKKILEDYLLIAPNFSTKSSPRNLSVTSLKTACSLPTVSHPTRASVCRRHNHNSLPRMPILLRCLKFKVVSFFASYLRPCLNISFILQLNYGADGKRFTFRTGSKRRLRLNLM